MYLLICIKNATPLLCALREVSLDNLVAVSVAFRSPTGQIDWTPRAPYSENELQQIIIGTGAELCLRVRSGRPVVPGQPLYSGRLLLSVPIVRRVINMGLGYSPIESVELTVQEAEKADESGHVTRKPAVSTTVRGRYNERALLRLPPSGLTVTGGTVITRRSIDGEANYFVTFTIR